MKQIAVIGTTEFTLGFRLTGIRKTFTVNDNAREKVQELLADTEVGIVIVDEKTMENMDERTKEQVVKSLDPVFVMVSATAAQDELRKLIMQSIGVDLLKDEKTE